MQQTMGATLRSVCRPHTSCNASVCMPWNQSTTEPCQMQTCGITSRQCSSKNITKTKKLSHDDYYIPYISRPSQIWFMAGYKTPTQTWNIAYINTSTITTINWLKNHVATTINRTKHNSRTWFHNLTTNHHLTYHISVGQYSIIVSIHLQ